MSSWDYEIFILACSSYAEKTLGTSMTSDSIQIIDCQKEAPGIFFYSEADAKSYLKKLQKHNLAIYRATIKVDQTPTI